MALRSIESLSHLIPYYKTRSETNLFVALKFYRNNEGGTGTERPPSSKSMLNQDTKSFFTIMYSGTKTVVSAMISKVP
jgi:hypothetical protein